MARRASELQPLHRLIEFLQGPFAIGPRERSSCKAHLAKGQLNLASLPGAPFPALNERGLRNIYVAEGPDFTPKRLTNYLEDDGQELTSVSLSADGGGRISYSPSMTA